MCESLNRVISIHYYFVFWEHLTILCSSWWEELKRFLNKIIMYNRLSSNNNCLVSVFSTVQLAAVCSSETCCIFFRLKTRSCMTSWPSVRICWNHSEKRWATLTQSPSPKSLTRNDAVWRYETLLCFMATV